MAKILVDFPNVSPDYDNRYERTRYYYRRQGMRKIRLPDDPRTEEFRAAYEAAKASAGKIAPGAQAKALKGTLRWLCDRYYLSQEWRMLDPVTQRRRQSLLERVCAVRGHRPFKLMERKHVITLRDDLTKTPHAANNLIKAMKGLFKWALVAGHVERNVMIEVHKMKTPRGGWHTWTIAEVQQYLTRHPIGTKPALALALIMFTGQRRSDAPRLGKQHRKGNEFTFTQKKNEKKNPVRLTIPVLPILDRFIAAHPSKGLTYLETAYGKPYSTAGFGTRMREWCDQADLKHCSAHGLRKAAATIAAENGATAHQLMSIFGWQTLQQAELYTRAAEQKRLAGSAMHLILPTAAQNETATEVVPVDLGFVVPVKKEAGKS